MTTKQLPQFDVIVNFCRYVCAIVNLDYVHGALTFLHP